MMSEPETRLPDRMKPGHYNYANPTDKNSDLHSKDESCMDILQHPVIGNKTIGHIVNCYHLQFLIRYLGGRQIG